MQSLPARTFCQNSGAEGASGRTAPTPTTATARLTGSRVMSFPSSFVRPRSGRRALRLLRVLLVDGPSYHVHVGKHPRGRALDGGDAERRLEVRLPRRALGLAAADPLDGLRRDFHRRLARADPRHRLDGGGGEAGLVAGVAPAGSEAAEVRRDLRARHHLAQAEQDVLVAGEPADARPLDGLVQRADPQRRNVRAHLRVLPVERLERRRHLLVELAAALQVRPPAVPRDGPLHDLAGALVDGRDADVAADLLDVVLLGVAVAAVRAHRRVRREVAGLGGEELRDGALGLQLGLAVVEADRRLLDVRARRLEADHVGDDELVRVRLLLAERRARLDALARVADGLLHGGHAGAEPERGDHQAREAEDGLRVREPLALHAADEVLHRDEDVLDGDGRGVRGADAVLVLGLARVPALRAALDDEEGGAVRRRGEAGVQLGHAAIGDELLRAVDLVADELAALDDAVGLRADGGQLAAGQRLGHRVGDDEALLRDAAHPLRLLLGRGADDDRIRPEEDG